MKYAIFQALPFPNLHHGTPGTLSKAFLILLACLSLTAGAQENQWQWKGGSNLANQPAVYGQGNFATSSPGGRSYATTWAVPVGSIYDSQPLWMFGGYGYDASGNLGPLNDFWSVNDDTPGWGWVGGSTTVGAVGVYGTQGVPSAANYPSARIGAAGWVQTTGPGMDGSGHLWLFGGEGQNDLWEYLPDFQEWVWMKGRAPGSGSVAGVYGTLGMPAAANTPGGRSYAASWTDANGNFWLFGGSGTDANGNTGNLNDLWEFNPLTNQWTWMGGSGSLPCNNCAVPSVYGTIGVPAAANIPGSRAFAQAWTDDVGNLWLFGGNSAGPSETANYLNDLWMFSPATNQWTWMGGANTPPSYGAIGVPAVANIPGSIPPEVCGFSEDRTIRSHPTPATATYGDTGMRRLRYVRLQSLCSTSLAPVQTYLKRSASLTRPRALLSTTPSTAAFLPANRPNTPRHSPSANSPRFTPSPKPPDT